MSKVRLLFCDDSAGVVKGFEKNVARPLAELIECETAASSAGVEALVGEGRAFDVVVTDLNFEKVGGGPKDGLEIIRLAREHWPECEPILMTAYEGSLDVRDGLRLRALGLGEGSLLPKTDAEDPGVTWLRLRERIQGIALAKQEEGAKVGALRRENRYLREALAGGGVAWISSLPIEEAAAAIRSDPNVFFEGQAGKSYAMQEVFRRIRRTAPLPSDVLILGPTGTGKDLVAHAIHNLSGRRARPFVKADLTTTSGNLVESELFGHERGAFTGADARKEGLIASAEGGTFFLDEIGNIAPEVQAKLLRVLEERAYRSLGSTKDRRADVRFIAATNVDLAAAVEQGAFRPDLYERLNVVRIVLPPLALRIEDVPVLAALFLDECRARFGASGLGSIDAGALELLMEQDWPRNVRQLKHVIERLFTEVDPACPVVDRAAIERVLEKPGAAALEAPSGAGALFRRILAGEVSLALPAIRKKHGEEVVREIVRRTMIHFRGLPDAAECEQYFGGTSANAWRQFAFQLGLTWKNVREPR